MSKVSGLGAMLTLAIFLVIGACTSQSLHPTGDMPPHSGAGGAAGTTTGVQASGGNRALGTGGMVVSATGGTLGTGGAPGTGGTLGTDGGDSGSQPGAEFCCPPDSQPSGCMHLGGRSEHGMCYVTCDFWGSSNWRIETDANGCPSWRYDLGRACMPPFCIDAGASHSDAGDSGN